MGSLNHPQIFVSFVAVLETLRCVLHNRYMLQSFQCLPSVWQRRVCSSTTTRLIMPPNWSCISTSCCGEQTLSSCGVILQDSVSISDDRLSRGSWHSIVSSPSGTSGVRFPEASCSGLSSAQTGSSTSSVATNTKRNSVYIILKRSRDYLHGITQDINLSLM